MAERVSKRDIDILVETLELTQYYPEKLTRNELYQITAESLSSEQREKCSPAWQFIYDITRFNYHARNIQSNEVETVPSHKMGFRERSRKQREETNSQVHPLDVLVAVYLCCDPIAKQDLVMHLWGCRLAMPLAVKPGGGSVLVNCWPFRSLIGLFQTAGGFVENQLMSETMKCIAFVRIGDNERYSKSYLLNCLIGGSEKPHPMFFHRNSKGSRKTRSNVTNGLIEIGWFLPSDIQRERFKEPRLFVNLRGDANELDDQLELIGQVATISFVLCSEVYLQKTIQVVNNLLRYGSRVIVIVTDQNPDLDRISNFLDSSFSDVPETKLDVVTAERLMLSEFLESLHHNIEKMEGNTGRKVVMLDLMTKLCGSKFSIDERIIDFTEAFQLSNRIIDTIKHVDGDKRKETLLPLQDHFWKQWSQLDRDFIRFDQLDKAEKKKYGNKKLLEHRMYTIRKLQFEHFVKKGISAPVKIFIYAMSKLEGKSKTVFLRMLKLELDKLSRVHLRPFYDRYQELVNQTVSAGEEERQAINKKLSHLDDMKTKLSFGLENIIREIGQLFEACESQPDEDIFIMNIEGKGISYKELSSFACHLLLEGFPIEILDGEVCSVPLLWVRQLFRDLPVVMKSTGLVSKSCGDVKVHTISVLGIQSSGKSTFLNTIFGLQFAVSAGRCTRGAFMQLVKVHSSLQDELKADFVLAIDTEGLKAAELISTESVKHDNELSTFVIGLADTTVINLMGENATYLQENLPIAVHAFLRMNLAGLHPRCTIVHHNVDKRNKEKLLQQGRILENILNKLTKKACELENIPHRMFHDLIDFSIANHTDYIPALYEGEQPMAPISLGYSTEADCVRAKLVSFIRLDAETTTLAYFAHHLENLWTAIKKDRFVYEFRTTLETEARLDLDKGYSRIVQDFLRQVDDLVVSLIKDIQSKNTPLEQIKGTFVKNVENIETKARENLNNFIGQPKKITSSIFDKWKEHYMKNLENEIESTRESSFEQFKNCSAQLNPAISMDKFESFFNLMMSEPISDLQNSFKKAWVKWAEQLDLQSDETLILTHTTLALQEVYPSHTHLLEEHIVESSSLAQFKAIKEKHLNFSFHDFSKDRVVELLCKLGSISSYIEFEYTKTLSDIISRKIPYTYRTPKQILLKMENTVSQKLASEDKPHEIANQYKIDILLCTAGSIVKDLYYIVKQNSFLEFLKREMLKLTLTKVRESKSITNYVLEVITYALKYVLMSDAHSIAKSCVLVCFESIHKKYYVSKQTILGYCLFMIIKNDKDSMLSKYVNDPEMAIYEFTSQLLDPVIKGKDLESLLKMYCRRKSDRLHLAIQNMQENEVTVGQVLNVINKVMEVDYKFSVLLETSCKEWKYKTVHLPYLKSELMPVFEHVLETVIKEIMSMLEKDDNLKKYCSSTLCQGLVGCKNCCPFCSEICKYSKGHPGKHECNSHRPIGCAGWHWQGTRELSYEPCNVHYEKNNKFIHKGTRVPFQKYGTLYADWRIKPLRQDWESCVWKWIFVNKFDILQSTGFFKLPANLPEDWRRISKKEALRALADLFSL